MYCGFFGDKGDNALILSCHLLVGFLIGALRGVRGSDIKMSSQKASTTPHWFSARYGDNSHNLDSQLSIRCAMDPLETRIAISLFYPAIS
jgi:hypothetical protein